MQVAHCVAKNIGKLYAHMGITILISLYVTRILMQSLGISDFGIFNLIGSSTVVNTFWINALSDATQSFSHFL